MASTNSDMQKSNSSNGSAANNPSNQIQTLITTVTALSNITKMKANIEHYKFSIQKTGDGPTIDFAIKGMMVAKEPESSKTNISE
jgi:hypothetical protein